MRSLSNGIGISNANIVADILDKAPETSPWLVYVKLGSYAFAA